MTEIIITDKYIEKNKTANGGFTKDILKEWGVDWPPQKGWRKNLIGKKIIVKKQITIDSFFQPNKSSSSSDNNPKNRVKYYLSLDDIKNTDTIFIYTDGACINNGMPNAKASIGIYFGKNEK